MRFNIDRMCKLAGVGNTTSRSSGVLSESAVYETELVSNSFGEGSGHDLDEDVPSEFDEGKEEDVDEGKEEDVDEGLSEMDHFDEDDSDEDQNEVLDIDEKTLVQELRRMKRIMSEAKSKSKLIARKKKSDLQEAQLRAIIDQEVKSVLKDLNLNSGWMYGDEKPQRSKKGYVNHGSFIKGIGFK